MKSGRTCRGTTIEQLKNYNILASTIPLTSRRPLIVLQGPNFRAPPDSSLFQTPDQRYINTIDRLVPLLKRFSEKALAPILLTPDNAICVTNVNWAKGQSFIIKRSTYLQYLAPQLSLQTDAQLRLDRNLDILDEIPPYFPIKLTKELPKTYTDRDLSAGMMNVVCNHFSYPQKNCPTPHTNRPVRFIRDYTWKCD